MAKQRLTKALRGEILQNVLSATTVQTRAKDIAKRTKEAAADFIRSKYPPGFSGALKTFPREWFRHQSSLGIGRDYNPINALPDVLGYMYSYCIRLDDALPYADKEIELDDKDEAAKVFGALRTEAEALCNEYVDLRASTSAFLNSCSTVEAVLERMPELAPHVPKIVKSYPVAVTSNLLAVLQSSGFKVAPQEATC